MSDLNFRRNICCRGWHPRRLTKHQDEFVAPLELAIVEGFTSISKDGTPVSNLLYRPAGAPPHQKLPTIFFIHGGPVGQDEFAFDLSRQMLAAGGMRSWPSIIAAAADADWSFANRSIPIGATKRSSIFRVLRITW